MADVFQAHRRNSGEIVEFTVDWPSPDDALQSWRWDADHNPFPATPLSVEFSRGSPEGPARLPRAGVRQSINVHGYRYSTGRGGGMRRAGIEGADLDDQLARIDEIWENGWRAQIEREANEVEYGDYEALSLDQLVRRMEKYRDQIANHMNIMFKAMDIVSSARDRLSDFLTEKLGESADVERLVSELLEGQWNASLEANAALWDVSQIARQVPEVERMLREGDAAGLLDLPSTDAASFRNALDAWLERYGRRSGDYSELMEQTWKEEPGPVIKLLSGYLDREDPRASIPRANARKQAVMAEISARLSDADRQTFEQLVISVAKYLPVKESRNSVMSLSRASLRAPALAAGRKLVAVGSIEQVDDVFFLTFAEIEAAGRRELEDIGQRIRERREEHELWRDLLPPHTIGGENPKVVEPVSELKGVGASKGSARGRARVILHLTEADHLQPGEILVTRSTTSAWTPLFLNAAAIVTDSGGMLSHCAVVAREYQLPAVVGTYTATRVIADGDQLEVDGTNGVVTFVRD